MQLFDFLLKLSVITLCFVQNGLTELFELQVVNSDYQRSIRRQLFQVLTHQSDTKWHSLQNVHNVMELISQMTRPLSESIDVTLSVQIYTSLVIQHLAE